MNTQIIDLGKKFKQLKQDYAEQEAKLKAVGAEWEDTEKQLIDAMIEEGVKSVALDGLGLFSLRTTNYLSVNAANKPDFYQYLKESGNGALLKEDVNPKTLTAFLGKHMEELQTQFVRSGLDEVDARNKALELLNKKGASYFTKRDIALKA
jgi:hypothetical protein